MAFSRYFKNESTYDYSIVTSVAEASSILLKKKFDVIISDYDLGDGNAFDILKTIAQKDNFDLNSSSDSEYVVLRDQVFIIVTGAGDEEIAVKAMKQGASDYLIKDIDFSFLAFLDITVKRALKRIKIEHEIREKNQILNGILNNIPIIVFRLNEDLKFSEIIGSGLKRFELKQNDESLLHNHITNIFTNLSQSTIKAISLTTRSSGHSTNFVGEINLAAIKGIFEVYLFFDNEIATGAVGFGIDITEKKMAEDKLNQVYLGVQEMFFQLNSNRDTKLGK
jgi:CheY-like chemotaxis protein